MKKSIPLFKFYLFTALIMSCTILFNACNNSHLSQGAILQKNWINWQITFKGNPSEKEKKIIFVALERYILAYLAQEDNGQILIDQITFSRTINGDNRGTISVSTGIAATEAAPTKVIGPRPPKKPVEQFPNIEIIEMGK